MDRILSANWLIRQQNLTFAEFRRHFTLSTATDHEMGRLDTMWRERLEDMGIAPCTEANFRTSGESGPIPCATS
ncbi:hypothetical protein N8I71_15465 [Roseibacterium sp. SDUM158016]|uniref:hypothetical protein n=1 Tax=Roseicyclus sediminis TaxID=2980997 RepID=UPI0021CE0ABA|nr:hypothetical protein [Roseibacterium sp. SDUM158016]MCU4654241.1 hypothetical protein [Roseibacterium sp. SDUM158016]